MKEKLLEKIKEIAAKDGFTPTTITSTETPTTKCVSLVFKKKKKANPFASQ